jgi:quinolinate synthase
MTQVNINQQHQEMQAEIRRLKAEKDVVLLAHLYQRPEIQDVADFVGDSLALSQQAAETTAQVIVFAGVHFMAESAKLLSPDKKVVLPEAAAGCPMADMVTAEALRAEKAKHPGVPVVCYVNSSAAVKAESDICCTSANAVKVVASLDADTVIFVPDRNLGMYVARMTKTKVLPWPGYCPTHERITADQVKALQTAHPQAVTLVHPECVPAVIDLADHVFSTQGILKYVAEHDQAEYIIGTEEGILHQLRKISPDTRFYLPSNDRQICPNMKATTLRKVLQALETLQPEVSVPADIAARARRTLERMLAVGR